MTDAATMISSGWKHQQDRHGGFFQRMLNVPPTPDDGPPRREEQIVSVPHPPCEDYVLYHKSARGESPTTHLSASYAELDKAFAAADRWRVIWEETDSVGKLFVRLRNEGCDIGAIHYDREALEKFYAEAEALA